MISVFCASRLLGREGVQRPWLYAGIASVLNQYEHWVDEVVVAVDAGVEAPKHPDSRVRFVNSAGNTQALAVTAALSALSPEADIICGLEDDDLWEPHKLTIQIPYLQEYDFVSCDVAEYHYATNERQPNRYNSFISGWVMKRPVLEAVGAYFARDIFYHVDIEWLGRLNQHPEFKRVHLVEEEAMPPYQIRGDLNLLGEHSKVRGIPGDALVWRRVGYESRGVEANMAGKLQLQADAEHIIRKFQGFPW